MKYAALFSSVAATAGAMLVTTTVFAQEAGATATASTTGGVTAAGQGELPGGRAAAAAGDSDHDMMVGTFAIGYLGRRTIAYGQGSGIDGADRAAAQAPVIGARYWINPLLGIDAGLGFAVIEAGKIEQEVNVGGAASSTEADLAPVTALLVHAGVPLALSNAGHFSFQVIPELNVGFATQKIEPGANIEHKTTGLTLDVGARGGAEIHFGFIGIPQLSLQGSIGLLYRYEKWKVKTQDNGDSGTYSESRGNLTTTVYDNPWNIFASNVSALYYF